MENIVEKLKNGNLENRKIKKSENGQIKNYPQLGQTPPKP